MIQRLLRWVGWLMLLLVGLLAWLWTALALKYASVPDEGLAAALSWAFVGGSLLAWALLSDRRRTTLVVMAVCIAEAVWFSAIQASNDGDWLPEVAVLADAQIDGDLVHLKNIRDFDYRTEDDYDIRYYDKTFDLTKLEAVDLTVSYWDGLEDIAHTLLSFDFGGDDVLCLSVEVRREQGEAYGGLPGIFKQFELIYVLGDERDLIRLRTNYRKEEVFLFRSEFSAGDCQKLLRHILQRVHELNDQPLFYRTIGRNCTTSLVNHVNSIWPQRTPFTKKILMNGYAPEQGYERGTIKSSLPFAELKQRCRINETAQAADQSADFSRRIRSHLPVP